MSSFLRPDERASLETIEKSKERDKAVKTTAKTAIGLGTAAIGGGVGAKILPFLSEYIPMDLAIKGISKVSPKIGDFLKRGMSQGLDIKEGLNFVKDSIFKPQEDKKEAAIEQPKQNKNIIEQESPELHQFILDEIRKGRSPIQAGALAFNDKRFIQPINKLKNQHKLNWGSIIENIFGKGDKALPSQQNALTEDAMNPPGSQSSGPPSAESQAARPTGAQQAGPGQQKLMEMLQKLNQKLGG